MDTQALLDLCRINEEAPEFDLGFWSCGTHGCLVGNFCIARPTDRLRIDGWKMRCRGVDSNYDMTHVATRFGITFREGSFLFASSERTRGRWGEFVSLVHARGVERPLADREAAIRRVRKFIYWKLKRREFMYDDRGCVREEARRMEGNRNFAAQARELACV